MRAGHSSTNAAADCRQGRWRTHRTWFPHTAACPLWKPSAGRHAASLPTKASIGPFACSRGMSRHTSVGLGPSRILSGIVRGRVGGREMASHCKCISARVIAIPDVLHRSRVVNPSAVVQSSGCRPCNHPSCHHRVQSDCNVCRNVRSTRVLPASLSI